MKKIKFLFTVLLVAITLTGFSQKIHFIALISPAPGTNTDKSKISETVDAIGRACQMQVDKKFYTDNDLNGFKSAYSSVNPSNNDVVWVYYSGHGKNSGDGWPQTYRGSIKETDVHNKIKNKNARLKITMFDCCNGGRTETDAELPERPSYLSPEIAYVLLFKNSKGDVKVSASEGNMFSYGSDETGGYFTSSFIYSMSKIKATNEQEQKNAWKQVEKITFESANAMCVQYNPRPNINNKKEQNPQFLINLSTNSDINHNFAPPSIYAGMAGEKTTVSGIAKDHNVSETDLRKWNNGENGTFKIKKGVNNIPHGEEIYISDPNEQ